MTARKRLTPEETARIQTALDVMTEAGLHGTLAFEDIAILLPPEDRPAQLVEGTLRVDMTGPSEWTASEGKRLSAALKKAWPPVTLKVGKREFRMEIAGEWSEW